MTESVRDSLEALRTAIDVLPEEGGLGVAAPCPQYPEVLAACPFAATVNGSIDVARRGELEARATELGPWSQGPFPLGEGLLIGAGAADHVRWSALGCHVDADLVGRRVLVIDCGAGYDAFAFAARGAEQVLACEPSDAFEQIELLESVYESGVDFRQLAWGTLDPDRAGTFDIVHCHGLLHRVLDPMALLHALRRMTSPGGSLLIGAMMLSDPERSEFLRFVPGRHAGDSTWWFVPGRLAFRWLVETAGFEVETEFGEMEGPRDGFPVVSGYLRARAPVGGAGGSPAPGAELPARQFFS